MTAQTCHTTTEIAAARTATRNMRLPFSPCCHISLSAALRFQSSLAQDNQIRMTVDRERFDVEDLEILSPDAPDIFVRVKCGLVKTRESFCGRNPFVHIVESPLEKLRPVGSVQVEVLLLSVDGEEHDCIAPGDTLQFRQPCPLHVFGKMGEYADAVDQIERFILEAKRRHRSVDGELCERMIVLIEPMNRLAIDTLQFRQPCPLHVFGKMGEYAD